MVLPDATLHDAIHGALLGARVAPPAWTTSATTGVAASLGLWLPLVPWDLSRPDSYSRVVTGVAVTVLVSSVIAGGVAFADRTAGQSFVVAAYLTTLALFATRSIAAGDALWPVELLLLGLVALGALVTAFALGRLLRTGSTMR